MSKNQKKERMVNMKKLFLCVMMLLLLVGCQKEVNDSFVLEYKPNISYDGFFIEKNNKTIESDIIQQVESYFSQPYMHEKFHVNVNSDFAEAVFLTKINDVYYSKVIKIGYNQMLENACSIEIPKTVDINKYFNGLKIISTNQNDNILYEDQSSLYYESYFWIPVVLNKDKYAQIDKDTEMMYILRFTYEKDKNDLSTIKNLSMTNECMFFNEQELQVELSQSSSVVFLLDEYQIGIYQELKIEDNDLVLVSEEISLMNK